MSNYNFFLTITHSHDVESYYLHPETLLKFIVTNGNKLLNLTYELIFVHPKTIMPKCCKCSKSQAKLNKGGFCKACFKIKYNPEIIESVIKMSNSTENIDESIDMGHDETINDRCMINVIKQSMLSERKWNDEMQVILKQQVEFLQNEIINNKCFATRPLGEEFRQI